MGLIVFFAYSWNWDNPIFKKSTLIDGHITPKLIASDNLDTIK
jgi:hypothetical protein